MSYQNSQLKEFYAHVNFFWNTNPHDMENALANFYRFCKVDLQHSESTAYKRKMDVKRFLLWLDGRPVSRENIRAYLERYSSMRPHTYKSILCSLRIFLKGYLEKPELIKTFRFPKTDFKPIIAPTKEHLKKLYKTFSLKYKALLLMYATSGLRESELLSATFSDINLEKRMVILSRNSSTKQTWVTFFNEEAKEALMNYLATRKGGDKRVFPTERRSVIKMFRKIGERVGVDITPQKLRDWFCCEMGELSVPDRYIDAFCGRVPRSILARHYTDYSPERLKRIYDRASLKVLS